VAADTALARAEKLAESLLPERTPRRRMLVIVNPYATTVSDRLKSLVVYALQSRYAVEAVDTQERNHATQLCREAAREGYDLVVAFGGDGTVNEAANGLVASETPLTCLPGGSTNVWCRSLGIPNDVVDATEHLLRIADNFKPFPVDLGRAGDRHFVFSSGVGLDASVVQRVDAHPYRKARFGAWYYTFAAIATFNRRYLMHPPRVRVREDGHEIEGVTVVVQNSDPFTFFRTRPIRVAEGAGLHTGTLAMTVLKRATLLELPTVIPRMLSTSASTVVRHRQIEGLRDVHEARVTALDDRPFPVHVDGDYVGDFEEIEYSVAPGALMAVA
jgi:diacylglycerol kinase family enzyme